VSLAESEDIVLEHLRHIRRAVGDELREDMRELKTRVGTVEREVAQLHVMIAEQSTRIDRLTDRVERIERRLDLAEA
jgi:uncharacterized coiled-coil protein SlyX